MRVVIVGNGAAGLKGLETFRKYDKDSKVTIISEEHCMAYSRVLIPYFLRRKVEYNNLFICDRSRYNNYHADTLFGNAMVALDENNKKIQLSDGKQIPYDKLLIATGSFAVKPPIAGLDNDGIYHMWTLSDAEKIDKCLKPGSDILILGSGFVALQAAWAAVQRGVKVKVFELMDRIMPQVLDHKGSKILQNKIHEHGVDLKTGVMTEKVVKNSDDSFTVYAKDLKPFKVDHIIVGTGVRPNISFLEGTSVEIDHGIVVDEHMGTNIPGIYAAGDVTQGATVFGKEEMCPLWPTAVEQGKIAGANMAEKKMSYTGSLSMNITQMFGITVASMGIFHGDDLMVQEIYDEKASRYIKITQKDKIPQGGIVIGDSNDAAILGYIRPLISNKKELTLGPDALSRELHSKFVQKVNPQDIWSTKTARRR